MLIFALPLPQQISAQAEQQQATDHQQQGFVQQTDMQPVVEITQVEQRAQAHQDRPETFAGMKQCQPERSSNQQPGRLQPQPTQQQHRSDRGDTHRSAQPATQAQGDTKQQS